MKSVPKLIVNDVELFFLYQLIDESYLQDAINYVSKIADGKKYTLVVSSNAIFKKNSESHFLLVFSDNSYREFSGWNLCLDAIQRRINKYSVLVFLNQTCNLYRENFLRDKLRIRAINKAISTQFQTLFGEVHTSKYPERLPKSIPRNYVNTAFFIIAKPNTPLKNIFLSEVEHIQEGYKFNFLNYADDNDYLEYVGSIVKGEHPKIKWHNYVKYLGNTFEQRKKIMTVVLEHRLSGNLIESGYLIKNILPKGVLLFYIKLVDYIKIIYKMKISSV